MKLKEDTNTNGADGEYIQKEKFDSRNMAWLKCLCHKVNFFDSNVKDRIIVTNLHKYQWEK